MKLLSSKVVSLRLRSMPRPLVFYNNILLVHPGPVKTSRALILYQIGPLQNYNKLYKTYFLIMILAYIPLIGKQGKESL